MEVRYERQFYTPKDIMSIMGIGYNKAIALFKSKSFPAIKFGHCYMVKKDEFEKWSKRVINSGVYLGDY